MAEHIFYIHIVYFFYNNHVYNLFYGILFVPLHRITDKFNDYDSRVQH